MNKLYHGDNFEIMSEMPDESIDLIYADPPFNTGNTQDGTHVSWRENNKKSVYADKVRDFENYTHNKQNYKTQEKEWHREHQNHELYFLHNICRFGELLYFMEYAPLVAEIYRILRWGGAFYWHIDYRTTHIWRIIIDKIFGDKNCFNSEIIWHYPNKVTMPGTRHKFSVNHNTILFFTKYKQHTPNAIHALNLEYEFETRIKQRTVWTIPTCKNPIYATQKPISLLGRIIKASSNEGDTVLDPFCGSGTTLEAAQSLGRQWIGIDQNPDAIAICEKRLNPPQGKLL